MQPVSLYSHCCICRLRGYLPVLSFHRSNIKPDKANANHHSFQMYTFDKTTNCKACKMFLR